MFFRLLHRNWVKTTGRVLDKRARSMRGGQGATQKRVLLYNYAVEFEAPGGGTTRTEVKQKYETREFGVGQPVPLLVRPDGKKAVFDITDERIKRVDKTKKLDKIAEERYRKALEG